MADVDLENLQEMLIAEQTCFLIFSNVHPELCLTILFQRSASTLDRATKLQLFRDVS